MTEGEAWDIAEAEQQIYPGSLSLPNPIVSGTGYGYVCPGCHGDAPTWIGPLDEKPTSVVPEWAYVAPVAALAAAALVPLLGVSLAATTVIGSFTLALA